MSGSGHYPGQSTYGGDYLAGASGSGGFPGQWTHGGDVVSGIIEAVDSSWIARPRNGVIREKSEWKPVITPASSYTLDSRPMEEITYLERPALEVSLDSGPAEGASCLEPLEQSVLGLSFKCQNILFTFF